jgi:hypothetical protein
LRKTTRSLKAICELCLAGYGEDAQILGRTVFELALTLAFITKPYQANEQTDISNEELAKLYVLHDSEEQIRMQQRISQIQYQNKCKEWNFKLQHNNSAEAQHKIHFKDYLILRDKLCNYLEKNNIKHTRQRNWNYMSLEETANVVGEPYECNYYFVYWLLSNLVHPSTLSSASYYRINTPMEIEMGIILGLECFWRVLTMTNEIFNLSFDSKIDEYGNNLINLAKLNLEDN